MSAVIEIERKKFLQRLGWLRAALGARLPAPIYHQFVFGPSLIQAFNGQMLVEVENPFPLKGGVQGQVLYDFVNSCRGRLLSVSESGEGVSVKSGRSHVRLQLDAATPFKSFESLLDGSVSIEVTVDWLVALKRALLTADESPTSGFLAGVLFWARNKVGMCVSSSSNKAYTQTVMGKNVARGFRGCVAIPIATVRQVLSIAKDVARVRLRLSEKMAHFTFEDEEGITQCSIWSTTRPLKDAQVDSMEETLQQVLVGCAHVAEPVPVALESALSRMAAVVAETKGPIQAEYDGNRLVLNALGVAAEADDVVMFDNVLTSKKLVVKIEPLLARKLLSGAALCQLGQRAWILSDKDWMRIVATIG